MAFLQPDPPCMMRRSPSVRGEGNSKSESSRCKAALLPPPQAWPFTQAIAAGGHLFSSALALPLRMATTKGDIIPPSHAARGQGTANVSCLIRRDSRRQRAVEERAMCSGGNSPMPSDRLRSYLIILRACLAGPSPRYRPNGCQSQRAPGRPCAR